MSVSSVCTIYHHHHISLKRHEAAAIPKLLALSVSSACTILLRHHINKIFEASEERAGRLLALSVSSVCTMPSSSFKLDVRATAGVLVSRWYMPTSLTKKIKACGCVRECVCVCVCVCACVCCCF